MSLIWELIKDPREFWFNWQWAAVRNKYPTRNVRPILRFRRGKWKHVGFRVPPATSFDETFEYWLRKFT